MVLETIARWTSVLGPLAILFVLSALPRLGVATWLGTFQAQDTAGYRAAADLFASDPARAAGTYVVLPPLLPTLMAVIGNEEITARVLLLLGATLAPIAFSIADRIAGRLAGWSAGLIAAFAPSLIRWDNYLLTDEIALVFLGIAIEREITLLGSPSRLVALGGGLATGMAYLARAAVFLPGVVLAAALALTPARRIVLGPFLLAITLVLAPCSIRNMLATGVPTPYNSVAAHLVWVGTQWNETGRATVGKDVSYPEGYDSWTQAQRESFWSQDAIRRVASDPLGQASLLFRKLWFVWLPAYPDWSPGHQALSTGFLVPLYGLAFAGIVAYRRHAGARLVMAVVGAYVVTLMITFVDWDARYRLPIEFLLIPLAGAGVAALLRLARVSRIPTGAEGARPRPPATAR
jgi:hypothetical protein